MDIGYTGAPLRKSTCFSLKQIAGQNEKRYRQNGPEDLFHLHLNSLSRSYSRQLGGSRCAYERRPTGLAVL